MRDFNALPATERAAVLTEADAIIEKYIRWENGRWSSSLIDESKHKYIYHPAVALNIALKHPMFHHVVSASRQRWSLRG